VNEDEMGGECSTLRRGEKFILKLFGKPEERKDHVGTQKQVQG
jgi:hypothetical protein